VVRRDERRRVDTDDAGHLCHDPVAFVVRAMQQGVEQVEDRDTGHSRRLPMPITATVTATRMMNVGRFPVLSAPD
jgi:hypothetical protein